MREEHRRAFLDVLAAHHERIHPADALAPGGRAYLGKNVERFGEVYAFSPASIFVHQNQPTMITFWNLQPDDQHDFSIVDADGKPLMDLPLAPLSQTSFIFTFHRRGILQFRCLVHQPAMSGQILVLPAAD